MVDHYCVAPWRMKELEDAEKERDEMKRNLTDEQLNYHANGCCTYVECNIGRKELADEIKRLRADNDEMKRKLAVFTEGVPTKVEIEQYMDIMNAMMKSEIARPRWHPVYTWLRRISEVQNVDR